MFSLLLGLYRESQVLLVVYVVDWTFILGAVDLHAHLFIDHRHVILCVFNFRGLPRLRNYFNSEILPIYSIF